MRWRLTATKVLRSLSRSQGPSKTGSANGRALNLNKACQSDFGADPMISNPFYSQENHGPYELYDIGNLELEEGGTLRACQLAYATFGKLNAAKDNAVLVPTWYSGTNKIMEQVYIGAGRALDPEKYFIIVVNQIGNGLSSSPHNTAFPGGMGNFPKVRIGDDVRAQHKLLTEKFGITSLALVVGGSMGAQQTYEWAVRYPDMVKRAAAIAGTAKNTMHDFLFTETLMDAITTDPGWNNGWYHSGADVRDGLRRHAKMWAVMGWSTEFFKQERPKALGFSSLEDFITNFMEGFFGVMDPNDLLCMAWKWQRGDVSRLAGEPCGSVGAHPREGLRDADLQRHVLPAKRLRTGAAVDPPKRIPTDQQH
ncbi:alpha/beta fold hydrolase [Roseateles sp. GG27B]